MEKPAPSCGNRWRRPPVPSYPRRRVNKSPRLEVEPTADALFLYPASLTPAEFVGALDANAGGVLTAAERSDLVSALASGTKTRAETRSVAENAELSRREFRRAFVLMHYFGYMRRNPDDSPDFNFNGYNFWLGKLDEFNGDYVAAEMVKAFISSDEYLKRFGQ